jgi:hypothetical protein
MRELTNIFPEDFSWQACKSATLLGQDNNLVHCASRTASWISSYLDWASGLCCYALVHNAPDSFCHCLTATCHSRPLIKCLYYNKTDNWYTDDFPSQPNSLVLSLQQSNYNKRPPLIIVLKHTLLLDLATATVILIGSVLADYSTANNSYVVIPMDFTASHYLPKFIS